MRPRAARGSSMCTHGPLSPMAARFWKRLAPMLAWLSGVSPGCPAKFPEIFPIQVFPNLFRGCTMRAPPTSSWLVGSRDGKALRKKVLQFFERALYWAARSPGTLRRTGWEVPERSLHEMLTKPERAGRIGGSLDGRGFGHPASRFGKTLKQGVDEAETSCQNERLTSTETSGHGGRR